MSESILWTFSLLEPTLSGVLLMNLEHEVEFDHSLSYQQVLKGSTCPTMLKGCHIVNSVCHADHDVLSESSHMSSRCCGPHGVMTPQVGQHAVVEDDHRVEDVATTRDGSGVAMKAGRGKVGQQGGSRNDVHRGGGHCGHEGLGRRGDDGGARRGRGARRVEDVYRVEDIAYTSADHGGSWRGGGVDRGGAV
ncbi:uncharacterized protein LOC119359366 [Triticum dicoccoides]|uniref:uncharacterized protein LOC119359366 n=1 Tax=Triticum dicoccoides TaxID=85692 RepID=UPI00188F378D|nr:uncharacterized protein LOC119359366 [Triticum dicoccoides]XP_037481485.1 uncharacterized protein LOC119359366 [Triticum dicoccoides]